MAAADNEGFVDISEEQDGGLLKKILREGAGDEKPTSGSEVSVHYVGTLTSDGSKFDSSRDRSQEFVTEIGIGRVIKGWDVGMLTMKKGELCILRARHDYAYGESGSPPKIPGGATLDFEVELFRWKEKVPDPEDMSPAQRAEYATKQKELGTVALKAQDWAAAVEAYEEGARYITFCQGGGGGGNGHSHGHGTCHHDHGGGDEPAPELSEDDKKLAVALLTNCAMAGLKLSDHNLVKAQCDKALGLDPNNVKALFRRGKAEMGLGELDEAAADASAILAMEPDNKEAETLRKQAEVEKKRAKQKEKAMYSKMFG